MRTRTVAYFIREANTNLLRNQSMSLASIGTVAVSLTILGLLFLVLLNLSNVLATIESKVEMRVFIRNDVTAQAKGDLKERISRIVGVARVDYIDKTEALKRLKTQLGQNADLVRIMGENPLPDSFQIKVKRTDELRNIAEVVATYPGVEEVNYGEAFVDKLIGVSRVIWAFTAFSSIAMGTAILFIIVNTIRITLFNRRKEIEIMKLVGATDWFIRWPFLLEGAVLGGVGALLATSVCVGTYQFAAVRIAQSAPFIPIVGSTILSIRLAIILISLGVAVGTAGSVISIRKFLHV